MLNENHFGKLSMFNLMHLITLGILILVIVLMYIFKNKINSDKFEHRFRITLALFLLVFESLFHIWIYSRGGYTLNMLPFTGFCALTNVLTIIALLTNKTKMFNVLIYYAIIGAFFSLVFVDTKWGFPHFRYFHYFLVHFGFLVASLYYYFTGRLKITFKYFKLSFILLFIYNLLVLMFDLILNENWFYLIENPVKEISDLFGLPFYTILWSIFIMLLMVFLYYLLKGFKSKKVK